MKVVATAVMKADEKVDEKVDQMAVSSVDPRVA